MCLNFFLHFDLITEALTQVAHSEQYGSDEETPDVDFGNDASNATASTSRWSFSHEKYSAVSIQSTSVAGERSYSTFSKALTPATAPTPSIASMFFKAPVSSKAPVYSKTSVPSKEPMISNGSKNPI